MVDVTTDKEIIKTMKHKNKVNVEDLMLAVIISFYDSAAELGCPSDKDVNVWIREMNYKNAFKVMEKLEDIIMKDYNAFKNTK